MAVTLKISNKNDTRRIPLGQLSTIEQLVAITLYTFGSQLPSQFAFQYVDDEDEVITFVSNGELTEAQKQATSKNNVFRISIVESNSANSFSSTPIVVTKRQSKQSNNGHYQLCQAITKASKKELKHVETRVSNSIPQGYRKLPATLKSQIANQSNYSQLKHVNDEDVSKNSSVHPLFVRCAQNVRVQLKHVVPRVQHGVLIFPAGWTPNKTVTRELPQNLKHDIAHKYVPLRSIYKQPTQKQALPKVQNARHELLNQIASFNKALKPVVINADKKINSVNDGKQQVSQNLKCLAIMGFSNETANIEALIKSNNKLEFAINILLQ